MTKNEMDEAAQLQFIKKCQNPETWFTCSYCSRCIQGAVRFVHHKRTAHQAATEEEEPEVDQAALVVSKAEPRYRPGPKSKKPLLLIKHDGGGRKKQKIISYPPADQPQSSQPIPPDPSTDLLNILAYDVIQEVAGMESIRSDTPSELPRVLNSCIRDDTEKLCCKSQQRAPQSPSSEVTRKRSGDDAGKVPEDDDLLANIEREMSCVFGETNSVADSENVCTPPPLLTQLNPLKTVAPTVESSENNSDSRGNPPRKTAKRSKVMHLFHELFGENINFTSPQPEHELSNCRSDTADPSSKLARKSKIIATVNDTELGKVEQNPQLIESRACTNDGPTPVLKINSDSNLRDNARKNIPESRAMMRSEMQNSTRIIPETSSSSPLDMPHLSPVTAIPSNDIPVTQFVECPISNPASTSLLPISQIPETESYQISTDTIPTNSSTSPPPPLPMDESSLVYTVSLPCAETPEDCSESDKQEINSESRENTSRKDKPENSYLGVASEDYSSQISSSASQLASTSLGSIQQSYTESTQATPRDSPLRPPQPPQGLADLLYLVGSDFSAISSTVSTPPSGCSSEESLAEHLRNLSSTPTENSDQSDLVNNTFPDDSSKDCDEHYSREIPPPSEITRELFALKSTPIRFQDLFTRRPRKPVSNMPPPNQYSANASSFMNFESQIALESISMSEKPLKPLSEVLREADASSLPIKACPTHTHSPLLLRPANNTSFQSSDPIRINERLSFHKSLSTPSIDAQESSQTYQSLLLQQHLPQPELNSAPQIPLILATQDTEITEPRSPALPSGRDIISFKIKSSRSPCISSTTERKSGWLSPREEDSDHTISSSPSTSPDRHRRRKRKRYRSSSSDSLDSSDTYYHPRYSKSHSDHHRKRSRSNSSASSTRRTSSKSRSRSRRGQERMKQSDAHPSNVTSSRSHSRKLSRSSSRSSYSSSTDSSRSPSPERYEFRNRSRSRSRGKSRHYDSHRKKSHFSKRSSRSSSPNCTSSGLSYRKVPSGRNSRKCFYCDATLHSPVLLRAHLKKYHWHIRKRHGVYEGTSNEGRKFTSAPPYCRWCTRTFEDRATLNLHLRKNDCWSYKCENCDFKFTTLRRYEFHAQKFHPEISTGHYRPKLRKEVHDEVQAELVRSKEDSHAFSSGNRPRENQSIEQLSSPTRSSNPPSPSRGGAFEANRRQSMDEASSHISSETLQPRYMERILIHVKNDATVMNTKGKANENYANRKVKIRSK